MNIRPIQQPRPPIWIAANNDPAIQRAARIGDTWFINPHSTRATLREHMRVYNAALAEAGKPAPAELPLFREIFCARDRETALRMAGPYLLGKYRDYATWGQDKAMPAHESFDKSLDELVSDRFVIGSPADCYEQLRPYWEEFGVNHMVFRTHWAGMPITSALSSMRLISDELLPELRKI